MGSGRRSSRTASRRRDDWLGGVESDDQAVTQAPARARANDGGAGQASSDGAADERQPGMFSRLRHMETPGMPHLARRYKVGLAVLGLGTFLLFAAFAQGYMSHWGNWGYLGAFLISLITSAMVILPAPGALVIFSMAGDYNPVLLGVVSGLGGGIGALTAYGVGIMGRNAVRRRRVYAWMAHVFRGRWGPILLFSFTLVPFLPIDVVSAMAGAVRYPVPKYLFWVITASIVKMVLIALAGAFATGWLLENVRGLLGG